MSTCPTHAELRSVVTGTGLWDAGRDLGSHRFRLSPQNFVLPATDAAQIDELSRAVYGVLGGVSQLMADAQAAREHGSLSGPLLEVTRALRRGSPYYRLDHVWPKQVPLWCKADLVVGPNGHLWIAETDATNPRSLGNAIVRRLLSERIDPVAHRLEGLVAYLVEELTRLGVSELVYLYADRQRFYAPEFRVVSRALADYGIDLLVLGEHDIVVKNEQLVEKSSGRVLPPWLVDLPNMGSEIVRWFKEAVPAEQVRFLIPPHNYLASKVLLGYLSNPAGDNEVETLLSRYIGPADLALVRRHLPASLVIPKRPGWEPPPGLFGGGPPIIKQGFASGTKGVWFPGDAGYAAALERATARGSDYYVAQREISQRTQRWVVYPEDGAGPAVATPGWRVRLTAYLTPTRAVELAATARQGTAVIHGNPDAIQAGVVFG